MVSVPAGPVSGVETGSGVSACGSVACFFQLTQVTGLASASIALNSAAMYAGQTIGAGLGGLAIAAAGYTLLGWLAAAVVGAGLYLSVLADRVQASR